MLVHHIAGPSFWWLLYLENDPQIGTIRFNCIHEVLFLFVFLTSEDVIPNLRKDYVSVGVHYTSFRTYLVNQGNCGSIIYQYKEFICF